MNKTFGIISLLLITLIFESCGIKPTAESEIKRIRDSLSLALSNNQLKKLKDSLSFEQIEGRKQDSVVIIEFKELIKGNQSGNIIKAVKIGTQIWMTENLNVDHFRNGDEIPEAKTKIAWKKALSKKQAAWCYFNNDPANGAKYGKLYNWYAVNDPRGLAPMGWHIPNHKDWETLVGFLGGPEIAGIKLKSKIGWKEKNGNNESGFSAFPGGFLTTLGRDRLRVKLKKGAKDDSPFFSGFGEMVYWWSKEFNPKHENSVWILYLNHWSDRADLDSYEFDSGLPVRCVKD